MTTTDCLNQPIDTKSDFNSEQVTPSPLSIGLYDSNQKEYCLEMWKTLEAFFEEIPLMCSYTWTSTWLEHYGDLIPHSFAIAFKEDLPCGICLLTEGVDQFDGPLAVNTLHLGTAGEPAADSVCVEYNALLVQPEDQRAFMSALYSAISENNEWDSFMLDGFASPDLEAWDLPFEGNNYSKD